LFDRFRHLHKIGILKAQLSERIGQMRVETCRNYN